MASTLKHLLKHWHVLADGGSGTWLWVRRVGDRITKSMLEHDEVAAWVAPNGPHRTTPNPTYLFVEIIDMVDACGRDMLDQLSLCGEVFSVDPLSYNKAAAVEAFESAYGNVLDLDDMFDDEEDESKDGSDVGFFLAEIHASYGHKAPLYSSSGGITVTEKNLHDRSIDKGHPKFNALLRELLLEANRYAEDSAELERTLDTKIVNKLGQTARSFADGTEAHFAHLEELKYGGAPLTPEQELVLKMTGACAHTLGGTPIPASLRD